MISLVLPAYNPGSGVERSVRTIRDVLRFRPETWEVVFACDGCTDGTPDRLRALAQEVNLPRVRVVDYPRNRGKGYAVRTGLAAARGQWRLFTDIDLHFLDGLDEAVARLKAGADVVIASRTHPRSEFTAPFRLVHYVYRRKLQSLAFSRVVRTLLPISYRDTQAGLKGLSAAAVETLLPQIQCDGFAFDCELLLAAEKHGFPVEEIPIRVRYEDEESTTRTRTALKMVRELWRIRRHWAGISPVSNARSTHRSAA